MPGLEEKFLRAILHSVIGPAKLDNSLSIGPPSPTTLKSLGADALQPPAKVVRTVKRGVW